MALFVVKGHQLVLSVTSVVTTELVRGVLAPFGHGMWAAILGGVIFSFARRRRLPLALNVLGTYLLVVILHAAFDSISGIIGYVVVSAIGLIPLVWLWRRAEPSGSVRAA